MATTRHRKPENWLESVARNGHGMVEARPLGPREQAAEALLMGLRLGEGVDLAALGQRFGLTDGQLVDQAKVAFYAANGLVWRTGSRLGVTEAGILLLDAQLEVIDAASLGAPYCSGAFTGLRLLPPATVGFRFIGACDWTITLLPGRQFRLPWVSEPYGVWRRCGFSRHFVVGRPALLAGSG